MTREIIMLQGFSFYSENYKLRADNVEKGLWKSDTGLIEGKRDKEKQHIT